MYEATSTSHIVVMYSVQITVCFVSLSFVNRQIDKALSDGGESKG